MASKFYVRITVEADEEYQREVPDPASNAYSTRTKTVTEERRVEVFSLKASGNSLSDVKRQVDALFAANRPLAHQAL